MDRNEIIIYQIHFDTNIQINLDLYKLNDCQNNNDKKIRWIFNNKNVGLRDINSTFRRFLYNSITISF